MIRILLGLGLMVCVGGVDAQITINVNSGSSTMCAGSSIGFGSVVSCNSTYQWKKNGIAIPGETNQGYSTNTLVNGDIITCTQVTTTLPCVAATSNSITITILPNPAITLTSAVSTAAQTVCQNTPLTNITYSIIGSTNATVSGLPNGVTYNYNSGVLTITGIPTVNGSFNYTVNTSGVSCGSQVSLGGSITVKTAPLARFDETSAVIYNGLACFLDCSGSSSNTFTFSNNSLTPNTTNNYKIIWGDGSPDYNSSSLTSISHLYNIGLFTLKLSIDGNNGCISSKDYFVFVGTNPAIVFGSLGNTDVCTGSSLSFPITGVGSNPPGTTYTVHFNDNSIDTILSHPPPAFITHTFYISSCGVTSTVGNNDEFYAKITASNPCKSTSSTVTGISVSTKPKADFKSSYASDTLCVNDRPIFTNTGNITTIPYNHSNCNSGSIVWKILPSTGYTVTGNMGSDNSSVNSTTWTSGDNSITVLFNTPGNYTVIMKAGGYNSKCGYDSIIKTICVNPTPTASFTTTKDTICAGASLIATSTASTPSCGINKYQWTITAANIPNCLPAAPPTFINGTSNSSANPEIKFDNPGTYILSLQTTILGTSCSSAAFTKTIIVKDKPTASLGVTPILICQTASVSATATANCFASGATYSWTFQNGTPATSNISNPTGIVFSTTGVNNISVDITNSCGVTTKQTTINISAAPTLTATPVATIVCNKQPLTINLSSNQSNITYSWTSIVTSGTATGNSNQPAQISTAAINNTITNTGSVDAVITYTIKVFGAAPTNCAGEIKTVAITVKPGTTTANAGADQKLCNLTTVTLAGNNPAVGTGTWSKISGPSGETITAPNTFNSTVTGLQIGVYVFQWSIAATGGGACASSSATVQITNRPTITIANAGNDIVQCDYSTGINNSVALSGNSDATRAFETGLWTIAAQPAGGNGTFSSAANPNATFSFSIDGVYKLFWTISNDVGCTPSTDTIIINVYAQPTGGTSTTDATVCKGNNGATITTTGFIGNIIKWQYAIGGSSVWKDTMVTTASINYLNLDTTTSYRMVVASAGAADGCNSIAYSTPATITVNAISSGGTLIGNATVCANSNSGNINLSGYSGNIIRWETSIDNGNTWQTLTGVNTANYTFGNLNNTTQYRVIVQSGICATAISTVVTIVVNPSPQISSSLSPPDICTNTSFNYTATSSTPNVKYSWSRAVIAGISNPAVNSSDSTGIISETLINTTLAPIDVIYQINLVALGCITTKDIVVKVNPTPVLTNSLSQSVCSGASLNIVLVSNPAGATYSWTRAVIAGISNAANNGTGDISETLFNITSSNVSTVYAVTLKVNGCGNTQNISVTVTPGLSLTSTLTPPGICSNNLFTYIPTCNAGGVQFLWDRPAVTGITPNTSTGVDSIKEVLVNNTTAPIVVTYTFTIKANGCSIIQNITDTVYPAPSLSSSLNPAPICDSTLFTYHPASNTSGVTFNWSRANIAGISNAANSGAGDISETLDNLSNIPVAVTYVFDMPANGCSNKQNVIVIVNPTPTVTIPGDTILCNGLLTDTIFFSGLVDSTIFNWTNSNTAIGLTSNGVGNINPFIVTNVGASNNIANISVTPIYKGCSGSGKTFTITVKPTPILSSSQTPATICTNTAFNYAATSATSNVKYSWSRAAVNGISNNVANSSDSTGTITETLIDTTHSPVNAVYVMKLVAEGCINTQNITLTVNPDAKATYTYNGNKLCAPAIMDTNLIKPILYPNANNAYQWFANTTALGSSTSFPGYTISNTGDSIDIKLIATSPYGCKSDSVDYKFYTVIKPTVAFTKSIAKGCGPLTVTFTNTTTPLNEPSYKWLFGNGDSSILPSPLPVTFIADTSVLRHDTAYYITLIAYTQCDTIKVVDSVIVRPLPRALFQPDTTIGCSIFHFHAINNSLGLSSTYYWYWGDGSIDSTFTNASIFHDYHTGITDTFTIKLVDKNECGIDSFKVDILVYPNTVFPKLIVNGQNTFACAPQNVQFINNSFGGNKYIIDFGDGSPKYITNKGLDTVYHLYTVAGTYIASVYGTNGCSDTITTQAIIIYQKPKALFSVVKNQFCVHEDISFTNLSDTGLQYKWIFGDGTFSNAINATHQYLDSGKYTVAVVAMQLVGTGSVCTDTFRQSIKIFPNPVAAIIDNSLPVNCQPFIYKTNLPFGVYASANWTFYNTNTTDTTRAGNNIAYTFINDGTYPIKLLVYNIYGCKDSVNTIVKVYPSPKAKFSFIDSVYCGPAQTLTYLNQTTYTGTDNVNYQWLVDNVTVSNNTQQLIQTFTMPANATIADSFKIDLIGTSSFGCKNTYTKKIVLLPKPQVQFVISADTVCASAYIRIVNHSTYADNFKWYLNGVLFSTLQSPPTIMLPTENSNYIIRLVASSSMGCGVDSVEKIVFTYRNPRASFTVTDSISCTNSLTANFIDNSNSTGATVNVWNWNFGDGVTANTNPILHTYTIGGIYTVTLVVKDTHGCNSDTARKAMKLFGKPVADFIFANTCEGAVSNFSNTSQLGFGNTKFVSQQWDFGDGKTDSGKNVTHIFIAPGIYNVKLTVLADSGCVAVSITKAITVYGKPIANFNSVNSCIIVPVVFTNLSTAGFGENNYQTLNWSFGDGTNAVVNSPSHAYNPDGNYQIQLIVSGIKCGQLKDTVTKNISIASVRNSNVYPIVNGVRNVPLLLSAAKGGISYNWQPATRLTSPQSDTTTALYTSGDPNKIKYTITIKDSNNCIIKDYQEVWLFSQPDIFVATGFTPNGDNINDILLPVYINIQKLNSWRVYDRWGNKIFETNDMHQGWSGKINGNNAPMETYVWVVDAISDKGENIIRKGSATLIRD